MKKIIIFIVVFFTVSSARANDLIVKALGDGISKVATQEWTTTISRILGDVILKEQVRTADGGFIMLFEPPEVSAIPLQEEIVDLSQNPILSDLLPVPEVDYPQDSPFLLPSNAVANQIFLEGNSLVGDPRYMYALSLYDNKLAQSLPDELRQDLTPQVAFLIQRDYPGTKDDVAASIAANAANPMPEYIPFYPGFGKNYRRIKPN